MAREPGFLADLKSRRPLFEVRARYLGALRSFFHRGGFLEVDPPCLVPAAGMEPHLDSFLVRGLASGWEAYLPTSPEFYLKKLLATGVERCFALAPAFRDEPPSQGHSPEFLMLEWYRRGSSRRQLMQDCADLLSKLGRGFLRGGALEREGRRYALDKGVEVLPLSEAFQRFAGCDWLELDSIEAWRGLARRHGAEGTEAWDENDCFSFLMVVKVEPGLAHIPRPAVVEGFPAFQAALAKVRTGDPRIAERFELYLAGVELANAYSELTDPAEQRKRYKRYQEERLRQGKPAHPADTQFLRAVAHLPECVGIALGADRLLALLLGESVPRVRHGCY
jgi:lysyl-tRNA synthetase class 2